VSERGPIQAFLEGDGPDGQGRTLFQVLAFDDPALERTHDFIQWLFPLAEPSGAVPGAPVLDEAEITAIQRSMTAQAALAAATDRMARFFAGTQAWLRPHDHNHLRITRIVRSLRLLRGDEPADAFRDAVLSYVEALQAPVSARSLGYWRTA